MLSPSFSSAVAHCLGAEWVRYAENKRRGGDNGAKGVRYEDFFAALMLAKELCGATADATVQLPTLEQQAEAIVDDLAIRWQIEPSSYYQCKNVEDITWTGGKHPLRDDFKAQAALSTHLGEGNVRTILVVPKVELLQDLSSSIPTDIAAHSSVVHFPYCDGRINRLVLEDDELRGALSELARVDAPTDDELANVLGALLFGISRENGRGPCMTMFARAQSLSPNLIRLMPGQMDGFELEDGFKEVLAKIDGLMYRVSRGFFHWEGFGTSGVFSENCLSQGFWRFQRRIVESAPTNFDEFEALL